MKLYVIRDWNKHFEKSQLRKVENATWVPLPCKHDGLGFRRLMALSDGPAIYGAWVLILQVAAKCPVRGRLADERGPLTAEELAFKTGCPEKFFKRALEVVTSERVGWVLVEEWESSGSDLPLEEKKGNERKGKEKTDTSAGADGPPPELLEWIDWWNDLKCEGIVSAGVSREPPSEAVLAGWSRVCKSKELRKLLGDRDAIAEEIRLCPFLQEGWFTLEKLLGGKNRDRAYFIQRINDRAYRQNERQFAAAGRPLIDPSAFGGGNDQS